MFAKKIYVEPSYRVPSAGYFDDVVGLPPASCPPLPGAAILFLDADNVLQRRPEGEVPQLEGLAALNDALRLPELRKVVVVACGQWKNILSLDSVRYLCRGEVGERLIDRTPRLEPSESLYAPHLELHAWLAVHPEISDYCVLEPFWPFEPHVESAVFFPDGKVFGESGYEVQALKDILGR